MDHDTQHELATTFRDRHRDRSAGPLALPNAWDAASAILYEAADLDAVGTSSAGVAASLGVPDGEYLSRDEMLATVERIAHSVGIPVSADIEAGYGDTPDAVAETVALTIEAGAVGVNLEDGTGDPDRPLLPVDEHCAKLRAAREAADDADIPLVVNGRTDVFWAGVGEAADRLERTVERANAYADAGSDCLFVPGVTDPDTVAALADGIDGPLNVLGGPGLSSIPDLGELGVARVSVGSGPMRATLAHLRDIARELRETGTYDGMADAIPYGELNDLLAASLARRPD